MATPRQIEANRLNAQRSTGPRTEAGKDASRFNALKHGIDAHSTVIPGENPAELEALAAEYHGQLQPRTAVENYLVNTLVNCDWLRRRLLRIQAELFRAILNTPDPDSPLDGLFQNGGFGQDGLQRLLRQISAADRSYFRALAEIRRLQRERQAETDPGEPLAPPLPVPQPPRPAAVFPTQFGFVPPDSASVSVPDSGYTALDAGGVSLLCAGGRRGPCGGT